MNFSKSIASFAAALSSICCACSSGPSGGNPDGGTGNPNPGGGGCASGAFAVLPSGALVDSLSNAFAADSAGLTFGLLSSSGPQIVGSASASGSVSTTYTVNDHLLGDVNADATSAYFIVSGSSSTGLLSVPRSGGGAPKVIFENSNTLSATDFVLDADNIYLTVLDDRATPGTSVIYKIPKATGTAVSIYTAPAGQSITNIFVDGSTLYWSETSADVLAHADIVIRSAPLGPSLTPSTFAIVPMPLRVLSMVEVSGRVIFAQFDLGGNLDAGITVTNGVYSIRPGGAPVLVDAAGFFPVVASSGAAYYIGGGLVKRLVITSAGPATPASAITGSGGAYDLAVDASGTVYYAVHNCIYKK